MPEEVGETMSFSRLTSLSACSRGVAIVQVTVIALTVPHAFRARVSGSGVSRARRRDDI